MEYETRNTSSSLLTIIILPLILTIKSWGIKDLWLCNFNGILIYCMKGCGYLLRQLLDRTWLILKLLVAKQEWTLLLLLTRCWTPRKNVPSNQWQRKHVVMNSGNRSPLPLTDWKYSRPVDSNEAFKIYVKYLNVYAKFNAVSPDKKSFSAEP